MTVEQIADAYPAALQVCFELRGNLRRCAASEVIDVLVVSIQADLGELFADAFRLPDQAFGGAAELTGLTFTVAHITAQLTHRH